MGTKERGVRNEAINPYEGITIKQLVDWLEVFHAEHVDAQEFAVTDVAQTVATLAEFPIYSQERHQFTKVVKRDFIESGLVPMRQEQHGKRLRVVTDIGADVLITLGYAFKRRDVRKKYQFDALVDDALRIVAHNERLAKPLQDYMSARNGKYIPSPLGHVTVGSGAK